jgi:hypothetical protein
MSSCKSNLKLFIIYGAGKLLKWQTLGCIINFMTYYPPLELNNKNICTLQQVLKYKKFLNMQMDK